MSEESKSDTDRKRLKKAITIEVPAADKGNKLLVSPGTEGYVVLSSGQFAIGVKIADLKEACDEAEIFRSLYIKESKPEPEIKGDFDIMDVGYADEEEDT